MEVSLWIISVHRIGLEALKKFAVWFTRLMHTVHGRPLTLVQL